MQMQITFLNVGNHYKPVTTIVEVASVKDFNENQKTYKEKALTKILAQRRWSGKDFLKYGYTTKGCKVRVYDKEKIDKENAENYKKVMLEKYASGEWKLSDKQKAECGIVD